MDLTTVKISKGLREELKILVAKKRMKAYDELIRYLIKIEKTSSKSH